MNVSAWNPAARAAVQAAGAHRRSVDRGWFYNDPAFREAESDLRARFGRTLGELRQRMSAAGITDPQARLRAETALRLHFATQFRKLYNRQAEIEQERRERRRQAARERRSRLLSTIITIGTRGLVSAALNRQRYHHSRSLNTQRRLLRESDGAPLYDALLYERMNA